MSKIEVSYFGKCYVCKEMKEIVTCVSWATQRDSTGNRVIGGFRNFCCECEKELNIGVNRAVNVKQLSELDKKVDLSKYKKCSKCKEYYCKSNDFSNICLVCYGRGKHANRD